MNARRASRDAPGAGSASGRVLLVGAAVFALAATGALVLADQQKWLKLGIIAALWAALVGAFLAAKYRRQLTDQEEAAADRQEVYELELEREIAARREYELEVVADAKRQAEESARDDLAALRQEMSTLRQTLESLLGGEFLVERYALRAESTRMRALENPLPARNNLKRLPAAQPKDDEAVPPVVREAETDLIERVREVHHARRDPPVPHPPQRAETRRPAARAERKVEPRQARAEARQPRMEAMAESWPAQRVEAGQALEESWPAQRVEARQAPPGQRVEAGQAQSAQRMEALAESWPAQRVEAGQSQPAHRVEARQPQPSQRMEAMAESWPAQRVEARQSPPQPARQAPSPGQRAEESWPAQRVDPSPARRAEPAPKRVDQQPDPGAGQWVELKPEPQPQQWVELEQESWPAARMERESRPAQQPDRQQERAPRRAAPDPPTRRVEQPQPASAEFPVPRKQPWVPEPHPAEVSDRWFMPGALQADDEWAPSWESGRQNGHDPDVPFGHQAEQTTWLAQYNNPQPAEPSYSSRAYVQRHRAEPQPEPQPEPEAPAAGRRHARPEAAEGGGGRRRRAEGQPSWQESMAFRDSGSHARPEPAEEPSGSHAAGRSVNELLASHGVESSPRRRRRRED